MKFIVAVEENGYEFRHWDELTEEIGDSIATSWNRHTLYETLKNKDFHINKDEFTKAINMIDKGSNFVVLSSQAKTIDLNTFLNNLFNIEQN